MHRKNSFRAAFTLIELLVVVTIIGLLIAIVIPSLSAARNAARETGTKAQLTHIATACENYYNDYGAYPGVFDDKLFTAANASTATFTGSQNLYLTLTRRFYPTGYAGGGGINVTNATVGALTIPFDQDPSKQTANYSTQYGPLTETSGGQPANLRDSYYPAPDKEVSTNKNLTLTNTALQTVLTEANSAGGLPCLVDYSFAASPMPILYYRSNYKYTGEYAVPNAPRPGFATDIVGMDASVAANRYVYLAATETPLVPSEDVATLQNGVLQNGTPAVPAGGFVLVAADRTRSKYTIVVSGGH